MSLIGGHPTRSPHTAPSINRETINWITKFAEQLKKFYDKVIAQLRETESVLIFGPGEAKNELEKRVARRKFRVQIVGVETADKMTDRQIATKVRRYFQ